MEFLKKLLPPLTIRYASYKHNAAGSFLSTLLQSLQNPMIIGTKHISRNINFETRRMNEKTKITKGQVKETETQAISSQLALQEASRKSDRTLQFSLLRGMEEGAVNCV